MDHACDPHAPRATLGRRSEPFSTLGTPSGLTACSCSSPYPFDQPAVLPMYGARKDRA